MFVNMASWVLLLLQPITSRESLRMCRRRRRLCWLHSCRRKNSYSYSEDRRKRLLCGNKVLQCLKAILTSTSITILSMINIFTQAIAVNSVPRKKLVNIPTTLIRVDIPVKLWQRCRTLNTIRKRKTPRPHKKARKKKYCVVRAWMPRNFGTLWRRIFGYVIWWLKNTGFVPHMKSRKFELATSRCWLHMPALCACNIHRHILQRTDH